MSRRARAFIDEPGAGCWRYRLVVQNRSSTVTTSVQGVWLTAREFVSVPAP